MALRLKIAREEKGLSLRNLERICGVTNGAIHMIESGQRSPGLHNVAKIASALDLKLSKLIADAEKETGKPG